MHQLCAAALNGDVPAVRRLNGQLAQLNKILFIEANPIPVKWALAEMGFCQAGYRLPLTPLNEQYHNVVRLSLKEAGLI